MTLCSVSESPRAEFGNTDCLSLLNKLPTSLWVKFSTDISKIHSAPLLQIEIDPSKLLPTVQFSRSVVSDSLWPHGLQHTSLPCPSPTSRACSNSCPSSRWWHPAISSSIFPFYSCPQSLPASESTLHMRWPKYWSFSFSIIPSKEHQKWIKMKTQQPPNYGTL